MSVLYLEKTALHRHQNFSWRKREGKNKSFPSFAVVDRSYELPISEKETNRGDEATPFFLKKAEKNFFCATSLSARATTMPIDGMYEKKWRRQPKKGENGRRRRRKEAENFISVFVLDSPRPIKAGEEKKGRGGRGNRREKKKFRKLTFSMLFPY